MWAGPGGSCQPGRSDPPGITAEARGQFPDFAAEPLLCNKNSFLQGVHSERGDVPTPERTQGHELAAGGFQGSCGQPSLEFTEHASEAGRPGCYLPGKFRPQTQS